MDDATKRKLLFHALRPARKLLHVSTGAAANLRDRFDKWLTAEGLVPKLPVEPPKLNDGYAAYLRHLGAEFSGETDAESPTISVLMPVYKPDKTYFAEALASVAAQSYRKWQLCIVDDASADPELDALIESFRAAHPTRVAYAKNPSNAHISLTTNRALELATGDYVTFLDHDDRLYPHALSEIARHIERFEAPDILYSDMRMISESGEAFGPAFFKPDWSPLMHLAFHYAAHSTIYRTSLVRSLGGMRRGFEGSQDYDLMLRAVEKTQKPVAHIPLCLYQWRIHAASTAARIASKPYAIEAATRGLREACSRRSRPAEVTFDGKTERYRVRFALPKEPPLVSIVIPTRDAFELVERCLQSVFTKSSYKRFEVLLVDHESKDPRCLELFATLENRHGARFRRLPTTGNFNFARLNNVAVAAAKGEYVVLLDDDTEVLTPEWIEELLHYAQLAEVGAVGPKLLRADRTIRHAGLYLCSTAIAGAAYEKFAYGSDWYYDLLNTPHEVAAVTGACLMIAKAKYDAVGGLDERHVPNSYGDVDFCLKLRAKGWNNLYTPYAELHHYESKTRGRAIESYERFYMLRKWGAQLIDDPYLNPNLGRGPSLTPDQWPQPELTDAEFQIVLKRGDWYAARSLNPAGYEN